VALVIRTNVNPVDAKQKILNVSASAVEVDIQGQLELTVVMADISKTVTTDLTIKNQVTYSDISVWAKKLIAVKGQTVRLNVKTDNFEKIKSWSWEVSGVEGTNINKSNKYFEITAPQVSGQQTMSIIYGATLFDDSEVMEVAIITVLPESFARSSFTFWFSFNVNNSQQYRGNFYSYF